MRKFLKNLMLFLPAIGMSVSPLHAQRFGAQGGIGSNNSTYSSGEPTNGAYSINGSTGNASLGSITSNGSISATGTLTGSNFSGSSTGTNTGDQTITLSGDLTGSGTGSIPATLATVNAAPGSCGGTSGNALVTTNAKGLVTSCTQTTINNLTAATAPVKTYGIPCQPTTGAIVKCVPEQVVTAGGYPTASAAAGMVSGGADNAGNVAALNALFGSSPYSGGGSVKFTRDPTQTKTVYYFSQPLDLRRIGNTSCDGGGHSGASSVDLVFAAGVDGVVQESNTTSIDGGIGGGLIENCGIKSLGSGSGMQTSGSGTITNVGMQGVDGIVAPPFAVGDGVIAMQKYLHASIAHPLAVPPGAYVGSVSGTSITLANGVTVTASVDTANNSGDGLSMIRLPAALADTANTTSGSATVTITGGTTKFLPGDLIWSSGFPWWSRVGTVTGSVGSQTLTIWDTFLTTSQVATATTTGSYIWRVPAGIRRLIASQTRQDSIYYWPIALDMPCSSGIGINCTASTDYNDFAQVNLIGRFTSGDNTGASSDYGSVFANNIFADIVEGGAVGSAYFGTNSNSGESDSINPIVGNCSNQNYSLFDGVYMGGGGSQYCFKQNQSCCSWVEPLAGFPLDAATVTIQGQTIPGVGTSTDYGTRAVGQISGSSYDPNSGLLTVNLANPLNKAFNVPIAAGDNINLTDLQGTGQVRANAQKTLVLQAGTTSTSLVVQLATGLSGFSITGGNVSTIKYYNQCYGQNYIGYILYFAQMCAVKYPLVGFSFTAANSLSLFSSGLETLKITSIGYTGYQGSSAGYGYLGAPRGLLLGSTLTSERMLNSAPSLPSNSWNLQGDFYLNQAPTAGGYLGWANTAAGANMHPAGLVSLDVNGVSWGLPELITTGAKPSFTGSGCSPSSALGGTSGGSFVTASACAVASTITITFPVAAPNGWDCSAKDETAHIAESQSADTTTSCTLYISNATSANDKIVWNGKGY